MGRLATASSGASVRTGVGIVREEGATERERTVTTWIGFAGSPCP